MKKRVKKIVRSLLPFWVETLYTQQRYSMEKMNVVIRILLLILPSFCMYTMSNLQSKDVRVIKYWLPYGMILSYHRKAYGKSVDLGKHSKIMGIVRAVLPYGYVLWWDSESNTFSSEPAVGASQVYNSDEIYKTLVKLEESIEKLQVESEECRRNQFELADRMDVSLLKLAVEIKNANYFH